MLWDVDKYKEAGLYFYLEATEEMLPNGRVCVQNHGEMIMLGGYSYLGLIGHPQINAAAQTAVDQFGTGTYGVRLLAGSLTLHNELESRIAQFKQAEAAATFASGYITNVATISSLLRKGDTVICDKLNHASIVDGCLLSMAKFVRFRHNDMPPDCIDIKMGTLARYCRQHGIFVQAVIAPVVPEGLARLRACVSAAHTTADIDYCADVIIAGGRQLGIIN